MKSSLVGGGGGGGGKKKTRACDWLNTNMVGGGGGGGGIWTSAKCAHVIGVNGVLPCTMQSTPHCFMVRGLEPRTNSSRLQVQKQYSGVFHNTSFLHK